MVVQGLSNAIWAEGALVAELLYNVMNLVAFIAVKWAVAKNQEVDPQFEGIGLWSYCSRGDEDTITCEAIVSKSDVPSWFRGVQAMITMGFCSGLVAIFSLILFTCCSRCTLNKTVLIVHTALQFLSVLFIIIGVGIFGDKINSQFLPKEGELTSDWAFTVQAASISMGCLGFIFVVIQLIRFPYHSGDTARLQEEEMTPGRSSLDVSQETSGY